MDYIHYNPVKHELVKKLADWPWLTYHKYIESGRYSKTYFTEMQEEVNGLFIGEA
jgi:putative transposase